jgi:hypothetical protein
MKVTMKKQIALAALLCATAAPVAAQVQDKPALLIVGTPHFANPGRDIVNTRVDDVTTPEREREIEAIVERLAAFRPTRVAVEWPASAQAQLDQRYADYRAGRYRLSPNEIDQIGLRLAARLGLERVDAVDWNDKAPGQDSDYDFPAWAEAHGRGEEWQARVGEVRDKLEAQARLMPCTPISTWLRFQNDPATRSFSQRQYYVIATFGDATANPGAAWVGTWYARNLRILNNLVAIAQRPQDRVVAVYGAGHGFLLDQQAREAQAFEVANTLDWLPTSPRDEWTRCPD